MWWRKYEPLLEAKPLEGVEVIKDLIAKEIVDVLDAFPPAEDAVEWEDPALEKRLRGRLAELPRVDPAFADVVLRVVALDLAHEIDAIDHMMRNDLHRQGAPTALHVEALQLLWRGIVEHLYVRKEETRGLLKGEDLVVIVDKARAIRARRSDA